MPKTSTDLTALFLLGEAVLIFLLFIGVAVLCNRAIFPFLYKKAGKTRHPITVPIAQGFRRPVTMLLKVAGLLVGIIFFFSNAPQSLPSWLHKLSAWLLPFSYSALRIAIIISVAWGLINSSQAYIRLISQTQSKLDLHMRKSVARFLAAVFNAVVVAFAVVIILNELKYNVNSLVAGLGLGGLTVALAAKDAAANFFGGLVIITERPFEIGDWISCSGIEGTVEDISLRSTKIRTGPGSLTIVPNATISNAAVTNWSGSMEKRRADFKLQLTYNTPRSTLREYMETVRSMLETDPGIATDSIMVRFAELGDSSLNIAIRFYTLNPAYDEFMKILERVNFSLLSLAEKFEINFAFPTRTLYILPDTPPDTPNQN